MGIDTTSIPFGMGLLIKPVYTKESAFEECIGLCTITSPFSISLVALNTILLSTCIQFTFYDNPRLTAPNSKNGTKTYLTIPSVNAKSYALRLAKAFPILNSS